MRILAIAQNTFRESIRDKALYVLLVFAATAILGSKLLGWISVGQDEKIVKDICLASIVVFGVLIAIFIGTSLIYKEVDKRTIYTILCRPMHRYEFILGKYFGLAALLAAVTTLMAAISAIYILLIGGTLDLAFFWAILLAYWELLLVTALAILMSVCASPIMGAFIVFTLFIAGNATGILNELPAQFDGSLARPLMRGLYYIMPNLANFNVRDLAANGMEVSTTYVAWALLYGAVYTAGVLTVAILFFEEKDV